MHDNFKGFHSAIAFASLRLRVAMMGEMSLQIEIGSSFTLIRLIVSVGLETPIVISALDFQALKSVATIT